jgi:hypothetical protein
MADWRREVKSGSFVRTDGVLKIAAESENVSKYNRETSIRKQFSLSTKLASCGLAWQAKELVVLKVALKIHVVR